jgi:hypothetical protein
MTFKELFEKVQKALFELRCSGLDVRGYGVQLELSIKSYRDLLNERSLRFGIPIEVDRVPIEDIPKGTIYGIPFVITQGIDRVLIVKEIEEDR